MSYGNIGFDGIVMPAVKQVVEGIGKVYQQDRIRHFFDEFNNLRFSEVRIGYIKNTSRLSAVPVNTPCRIEESQTFTISPSSKSQKSEHVSVDCGDYVIVRDEPGLHASKKKVYFFFGLV